jgi:hypothetical protein
MPTKIENQNHRLSITGRFTTLDIPSKVRGHRPENRVVRQHQSSQLRERPRKPHAAGKSKYRPGITERPWKIDQRLIAWMTKPSFSFFLWYP